MTRDEAVAEVQSLLSFTTILTAAAVTGLKSAQRNFEQNWPDPTNLPWFLISERVSTSTEANEERLGLPGDWLADMEEDALWVTNDDGLEIALPKNDIDSLRTLYANSDPGLPRAYAFDGMYYRLFPRPDKIYAMKMQYYKEDAVLADGSTENKWLKYAANALIGHATLKLAGSTKNAVLQVAMGLQNDCIAAINAKSIWIKIQGRQLAIGEDL